MNDKKEKQKNKVTLGEQIKWNSSSMSVAADVLIMGYVNIYCTDTLNMSAALVGVIIMCSKIFAALFQLVAGVIVDRTHTKMGKGRPWELSLVGLWLCTWLLYSTPAQWNMTIKVVWVALMYVFVAGVFTSFLNASRLPYLVRAFKEKSAYNALVSFSGIFTTLFSVVISIIFPILMKNLATSDRGWRITIAIFALPLLVFGLLRFLTIKETNNVDIETKKNKEKASFADIFKIFKTDPYIWVIVIANFITSIVAGFGVQIYYFKYIVHDIAFMGVTSFFSMFALILMIFMPKLLKKFSAKQIILWGYVIGSIGYVVLFFAGSNIALISLGTIICGFGQLPPSYLIALLLIEMADYNEYKGIPRLEGTLSSINTFSVNAGQALGVGIFGLLLSLVGYSAGTSISGASEMMIRLSYSLIPGIVYLVSAFVYKFYTLDKKSSEIEKAIKEKREEASK